MATCPVCGEESPPRARFCWSCGNALALAQEPPREVRKTIDPGFTLESNPPKPFAYAKQNSFLLLSAYFADRAVKHDQRAINSLESEFDKMARQVTQAAERGRLSQQLLEYRVKVSVSLLSAACGKSDTINLNMPRQIELHVLGY